MINPENFRDHEMEQRTANPTGKSAVLIPLIRDDADETGWKILFEVRASHIRQGGDVCFPGGRMECGEKGREAAVRETAEELLISPASIDLISPMVEILGPRDILVKSYLGILKDYQGTYSGDEVDRVFTLPLSWFMEHEPRAVDVTYSIDFPEDFPFELIEGGRSYPFRKMPRTYYFYETPEGVIWGLTASILRETMTVLGRYK